MTSPETQVLPASHRQTRYEIPATATEFLLVRHGATESFVDGKPFPLCDGHGDPALAETGEEQARRLVARLLREHIDAIYVTTLRRTHQTIAPYLMATGRTAEVEPDLREVFLGEWEGGEVRARAAAGDPLWAKSAAEGEWGYVPGAETTRQLTDRCTGALERLHARHPGQRVVCVVHGGVIAALCRWATGSSKTYSWGAENASVHRLVVDGAYRRLHLFNDTSHLDHQVWQ